MWILLGIFFPNKTLCGTPKNNERFYSNPMLEAPKKIVPWKKN